MKIEMAYDAYRNGRMEKAFEILTKYVFSEMKKPENINLTKNKIKYDFLMLNRNEKLIKE